MKNENSPVAMDHHRGNFGRRFFLVGLALAFFLSACAAQTQYISPTHFTGLAWTDSDSNILFNLKTASGTNWINQGTTSTNYAPGVLTNWPVGTVFCVTATNPATQQESDGSAPFTNPPALAVPKTPFAK